VSTFDTTTGRAYNILKSKISADMIANIIPMLASLTHNPLSVGASLPPSTVTAALATTGPDEIAAVFAELRRVLGAGVVAGALPSTFTGSVGGEEEDEAINEYYSSLLDFLKYPIVLKLKTVPMLGISSPKVLFKRVVVLVNTNSGMPPHKSSADGWNRIMSGVYYILGFKHVFSSKQAYSQFLLIREPFNFASYILADYGTDSPDGDEFSITRTSTGEEVKY
jgi:hypothetical protein